MEICSWRIQRNIAYFCGSRLQEKNSDPLEKEANAFAGSILVPMFLLAPIAEFAGVSELARMFAVSEETIEYRLKYV